MKPGRKRKLVDEVRSEWQVSIRRACTALEFDRSTYHYKSRRSGQAALEHRIKEICHARVRYGYRRVQSCCVVKVGATARTGRGVSVELACGQAAG